jgi:hypothetical protein
MKLEDKFLKSVIFPFFFGVAASIILVTIFLFRYSYKCLDQRSFNNVLITEHNLSQIDIMTINNLISRPLVQSQLILEEGYSLIENLVEKSNIFEKESINDTTIVNGYQLAENFSYYMKNRTTEEVAIWFIDQTNITVDILKQNSNKLAFFQLSIIAQTIHFLYSIYTILNKSIDSVYFVFDNTDLFVNYPATEQEDFIQSMKFYDKNPNYCADEGGKIKTYYYYKCRDWYLDYQYFTQIQGNENKSYILIPPYNNINQDTYEYNPNSFIFTLCKKFIDPIQKKMYNIETYVLMCVDGYPNELFDVLDEMNIKFRGYFLVTDVNFVKPFYYPKILQKIRNVPLNDFEFSWDEDYYLEEKINFTNKIINIMNKDYMTEIMQYLTDESKPLINNYHQISLFLDSPFYFRNGKLLNFTIHPILINNDDVYQHILTIIFVYNEDNLYEHLFSFQNKFQKRLFLELIIFVFFGFVLLAMVRLTVNSLAKFIIVPIKQVQYMLRGINIGGENRLDFLTSLKFKKQEDINSENGSLFNPLSDDDNIEEKNKSKKKKDKNNKDNEFNSYYEEDKVKGENIERELHFFDFDEGLLQYRPKEINNLVKILLGLKQVLMLTSTNNNIEKIINYSTSENIFFNIKNKEGTYICQSNIGNLESQILNYDKAIYHLCLSLQDPKLKKFLSKTLSDELDVSNTLLHMIDGSYNKNYQEAATNLLVKKQKNSFHKSFSQRVISNLINNRYNKLIHIYFKFFSFLQKSNRRYEDLSGLFMHTSYHTIDYYHKIIIQYIFLCYSSNDLIKIGESILDYIEFLLKFKLKTDKNNKNYLYKQYENIPFYKEKQNVKRKIFDKIIEWFDLFDHYVNHVNDNTALGSDKSIIDAYNHNINNLNEINSGNQSAFLYKVHIQRGDFLRAKFALICHDYSEAIFYFIKASKSKTIVLDGLIKKKALKHLNKLIKKLKRKINQYNLTNSIFEIEFNKNQKQIPNQSLYSLNFNDLTSNRNSNPNESNSSTNITYSEKLEEISKKIIKDIDECNTKQLKDILIIVDGINIDKNPYEVYLDESKTILKNYLTGNDRFSMFIFNSKCRIVCPMMKRKYINLTHLIQYFDHFTNKFHNLGESSYKGSFDNEENEIDESEYISSRTSSDINYNQMNIKEIIASINYCINYLLLKGVDTNEKFLIYFTHLFSNDESNYYLDEGFRENFTKIKKDKNVNFVIVGKFDQNSVFIKDKDNLISSVFNGFGDKSELVSSENMNIIKTILSCNNIINDNIIFPNEIFQSNK